MKKRWAMGLLCCLLLFQLAFPAKAAGSVYFVAAEESVLPVTDATMPFWANGYLYVPASVFTNLGISVINNTAKKMTVLEKDRRAMLFDWAKGTAQDSSGSLFTPGVIQSGGLVFVPASTVANFFGLQYSVTDVTNGYLVWLRSPDFGMSAKDFANAATYNMEERYNAYNRDATSSTTPNIPVTPSAPTRGARIHLCLEADQRTSGLLDALDRANGWATFYCTPDFLESNGELLRRMAASGHAVGILAESGEDTAEQLRRGNEALYRATLGKTRLAYVPDAEETELQALEEVGWRCLTPSIDRADYKLESSSNASTLMKRVSGPAGGCVCLAGDHCLCRGPAGICDLRSGSGPLLPGDERKSADRRLKWRKIYKTFNTLTKFRVI